MFYRSFPPFSLIPPSPPMTDQESKEGLGELDHCETMLSGTTSSCQDQSLDAEVVL